MEEWDLDFWTLVKESPNSKYYHLAFVEGTDTSLWKENLPSYDFEKGKQEWKKELGIPLGICEKADEIIYNDVKFKVLLVPIPEEFKEEWSQEP